MNLLARWIIMTLAISITGYLIPGVIIQDPIAAIIAALILGIINAFIRPLLIVLTLPLTVLTFGLFIFIINALLVMLAAQIVPGFTVLSFGWAFLFAIVLAIIGPALIAIFSNPNRYQ